MRKNTDFATIIIMIKILIATTNHGKLAEIKLGLSSLLKKGISLVTLDEAGIKDRPEETGKTFEENSKLKAKFYGDMSGLPTIADDGGIIIRSLNNEPSVKSRRWPGYEASDQELIDYTLHKLKGFPKEKRKAYLETCICFYNPTPRYPELVSGSHSKKMLNPFDKTQGKQVQHDKGNNGFYICQQEHIDGTIAEETARNFSVGYPYRALFIVDAFQKYYDELTHEEHDRINHRLRALRKLRIKIEKSLLE